LLLFGAYYVGVEPRNPALREHVTRVGFNLSLTTTQIAILVEINECWAKDRHVVGWGSPWSHFASTSRALRVRGLVWHEFPECSAEDRYKHPPSEYFGLTAAGQFVVGLLSEAGLYEDVLEMMRRHEAEGRLKTWSHEQHLANRP
jgi:hypothetical protein